jgi:hypothetical protein
MHAAALLLLLPGLAACTGFTIPANQPDGVYVVDFNNDGEAVHTLIGPALNQTEVAQLAARDKAMKPSRIHATRDAAVNAITCGGYELDHISTDAAVEALKGQCGPGAINDGKDFYSIAGSTVAYVCNFASNPWICYRDELTDTYQQITNFCGWYQAGWREFWRDGNTGALTGYEDRSKNFCGRGVNGK